MSGYQREFTLFEQEISRLKPRPLSSTPELDRPLSSTTPELDLADPGGFELSQQFAKQMIRPSTWITALITGAKAIV